MNLLEWLKLKQLTVPSMGKDMEQLELSHITKGTATLKKILAVKKYDYLCSVENDKQILTAI